MEIRINKYLSSTGYCSRREADKLIELGAVKINGEVPEKGTKITGTEEITVYGKPILKKKKAPVYLAFNKPVGIVCTTDTRREKDNIIDYINYPTRIFPIGRLDKMSEGLILLTDDGDIVNKILRSKYEHEKEYIVTVNKTITRDFVNSMIAGVPILDQVTKKCKVSKVNQNTFKIILTQGLNRQIRRMCEYFDYKVTKLERVRIMHINLDVSVGKYRHLRKDELDNLYKVLDHKIN